MNLGSSAGSLCSQFSGSPWERRERDGGQVSADVLPLGDGAGAGWAQVPRPKNQCAGGGAILSWGWAVPICRPQLDSHPICDALVEFLRFLMSSPITALGLPTPFPAFLLVGFYWCLCSVKPRARELRVGAGHAWAFHCCLEPCSHL